MNLLAGLLVWFAAIAPFTERGEADFDMILDALNPWGSWAEVAPNDWRYHPDAAVDAVPFTRGQWIYTDFGWSWAGKFPGSWATDHYGWWVLEPSADGTAPGNWGWHPGPDWHAAPVDFRQTKEYIGWRPSKLGPVNELLEKDDERFAHPEEWIWVPKAKFGQPLEAADVVTGAASKAILEDSAALTHVYTSWREIERPGPDPAGLNAPGMLPVQERKDGVTVKPFEILSLPTLWAALPAIPDPNAIYLYRPEMFQDHDGVERRVKKWYNPDPQAQAQDKQAVNAALKDVPVKDVPVKDESAKPGQ